MKKLIKYQLLELKNVFLVYYLIMFAACVWSGMTMIWNDNIYTNISGADFSSVIVFFITAISCFAETFRMWIQNNISRKRIVGSLVLGALIIGALNSVIDYLFVIVGRLFAAGNDQLLINSTLGVMFQEYIKEASVLEAVLIDLLFVVLAVAAFMMIGYFIAVIFYRAGKIVKRIIAVGIPVGIFVILPIVTDTFYDSVIIQKLLYLLSVLSGSVSGNPWVLMATLTGLFVVFAAFDYLLIRHLQINEK